MLDDVIKNIVKNELLETNTTMACTVVSVSPLVIQPIPKKNYLKGAEDYPLIGSARTVKLCVMEAGDNFTERPVLYDLPLAVGNKVMVAFGKKDLSDAIVLGVIE